MSNTKTYFTGLLIIAVSGCGETRTLRDWCGSSGGDAFCEAQNDGRPYCSKIGCGEGFETVNFDEHPYGCRAEMPPLECYVPNGDIGTETSTEGSESTGGTNGGETGSESSSSDGQLLCSAESCTEDPFAPVCGDDGQCIGCTQDHQCASLSFVPGEACDTDTGACVQCTPENQTACDGVCGDTNVCLRCTTQYQCADRDGSVCNRITGACEPVEQTVCVDGDDDPDLCRDSLTEALADVAGFESAAIIVHELDNDAPYNENLSVATTQTLFLYAAEGEEPIVQGTNGSPTFAVANAQLTLEGLRIESNGDGVEASGDATVILRETTITGAGGLGIQATGATLDITRSRIVNNDGGGIALSNGAAMSLVNSFVAQSNNDTDAVSVGNESSASILYSSLSALVPIEADARALVCGASAGVVTARNSLFVAAHTEDEVECATLQATRSASEMSLAGDGNVELGDFQSGWFESLAGGNLLLDAPPAALLTTARWLTDDPTVDIDGDERFTAAPTNDTPDVAGADSLAPVEVGGQ